MQEQAPPPKQEKGQKGQKGQPESEYCFQILEEGDPHTKEPGFFLKMAISKEIKMRMAQLDRQKKDRIAKLEEKEKTKQFLELKQKLEFIRKLDAKSYEQQRKKNMGNNEINKLLADQDHFKMERQRLTFPLFESFQNRGKSPYIKFSYALGAKNLIMRINKNYFLNVLKLSRKDLFNIALSFMRTWETDFNNMIKTLWKIYTEIQKPNTYSLFIRALDLISVTFDVIYYEKKVYRFRYSPFEFRTSPTFKNDNPLTGYFQTISCIPELNYQTKSQLSEADFYSQHRLYIFDDLTDDNIFYKILNRTNLFFQVYSISKGTNFYYQLYNEPDDFLKKSVGHFYLSTVRMKKFIFTWPMKQFNKKGDKNRKMREEQKQIILSVSFQLQSISQQQHIGDPAYKMKMQILESTKLIANVVKDDISYRIKDWYLLNKEVLMTKERTLFEVQKSYVTGRHKQKDIHTEDYQTIVQFTSKDKFEKFFIGLLLLVSTSLDRHYFTIGEEKKRQRQMQKTVILETYETKFISSRRQYLEHYHSLKLFFKHTYYSSVFFSTAKEEQKLAFDSFVKNSSKPTQNKCQYRLKFGQWKFQKMMKAKKKVNTKNKEEMYELEQAQLLSFPEQFKKYISTLIKHFPLRVVYKDILSFVESICKICYSPQEESNTITLTHYEHVMKTIVSVLLAYYYYSQARQRSDKNKEKEKEKQSQKEVEQIQENNNKKQRPQDSFSRVLFIKILTKGQIGFLPEEKLLFQVTFKIMECRTVWHTRLKEGCIVIRVFQDHVDFEKDYNCISSIKGDLKNKKIYDEATIRSHLEGCYIDPKSVINV